MPSAETVVPNGAQAPENAPFKILILDANQLIGEAAIEFLETEGHQVLHAGSAVEALALTSQFQPDLILLDNEVAHTPGHNLLSELLMEQTRAAVVVLAKHPKISDAVDAIRQGATDYVEGPLDLQKLGLAIESQKSTF